MRKGGRLTAYIPGIGHSLKKFSKILVRGRGPRDLPAVRYSCVRGFQDFVGLVKKKRRRSIYGAPQNDMSKIKPIRKYRHSIRKAENDRIKKEDIEKRLELSKPFLQTMLLHSITNSYKMRYLRISKKMQILKKKNCNINKLKLSVPVQSNTTDFKYILSLFFKNKKNEKFKFTTIVYIMYTKKFNSIQSINNFSIFINYIFLFNLKLIFTKKQQNTVVLKTFYSNKYSIRTLLFNILPCTEYSFNNKYFVGCISPCFLDFYENYTKYLHVFFKFYLHKKNKTKIYYHFKRAHVFMPRAIEQNLYALEKKYNNFLAKKTIKFSNTNNNIN